MKPHHMHATNLSGKVTFWSPRWGLIVFAVKSSGRDGIMINFGISRGPFAPSDAAVYGYLFTGRSAEAGLDLTLSLSQ